VLTIKPQANANNKLRIAHSSVKRQRTYVVILEKSTIPLSVAEPRLKLAR
jgi:hypothetical protein